MKTIHSLTLLIALAACAVPAKAVVFVYEFTATVIDTAFADDQGVFPETFGIGTALTGTLSWDSTAASISQTATTERYQDPINGTARLSTSGGGISITAPGTTSTSSGYFQINNESISDDAFFRQTDISSVQHTGFAPDLSLFGTFNVGLIGTEVFADTSIPNALNLGDFDQAQILEWVAVDGGGNASQFRATINTLTVVPEPVETTLLFAGLCGLALVIRRLPPR